MDLRQNNGKIPKFDEFWSIVSSFVEEKTAENDRRHSAPDGEGSVVVNMALAYSFADLYRQCVTIAKSSVFIPSYAWFLLQFWPTTRTVASTLRYTGRFKIKRMVQARILRKNNPDAHYGNAICSFLHERD